MEINNVKDIIKMPEISKNILRKMYDVDEKAGDFEIARKMDLIKSDKGVELLRWYYNHVDGVDLERDDLREVVADIIGGTTDEAYEFLKKLFVNLKLDDFNLATTKPEELFLYNTLAINAVTLAKFFENITIITNTIKAISIAENCEIDFEDIKGGTGENTSGAMFASHIFQLTAHRFSEKALEIFYNFVAYQFELNYFNSESLPNSLFVAGSSDVFTYLLKTNTDALALSKKIKSKIMNILESSDSISDFVEKFTGEQKLINAIMIVNGLTKPEVILNTFRCSFDETIKDCGIELAQTYADITTDMQKKIDDFTVLSLSNYLSYDKLDEITRELFKHEKFKNVFSLELIMNFMSVSEKLE